MEKKSKAEKAIDIAMTSFLSYQEKAEEWFHEKEEERWTKESEQEERRRKEDRVHELRVLQMLGNIVRPDNTVPPYAQPFEYDNY